MAKIQPNKPVLIQNRAYHTVLELIDRSNEPPVVALRPLKATKSQQWIFQSARSFTIQSAVNQKYLTFDKVNGWTTADQGMTFDFVNTKEGTVSFNFKGDQGDVKYLKSDPTGLTLTTGINTPSLDSQLFTILDNVYVPAQSPEPTSKRTFKPVNRQVYRIRSHDGLNLLTMPENGIAPVSVDRQLPESAFQRWLITRAPSGNYTIQCAANQTYLACLSPPSDNGMVAPLDVPAEWKLQDVGGFAWSIRPDAKDDFSLGTPSMEVNTGDLVKTMTSDDTPSQIWFIEKYTTRTGDDSIKAAQIPNAKYKIQSAIGDPSTFVIVANDGDLLAPSSRFGYTFELKHIGSSTRFTLTYTPEGGSPIPIGDAGGILRLTRRASEFILLEGDEKGSYYIALADAAGARSRQVVSSDTLFFRNNEVFPIEDIVPKQSSQLWKFDLVS